MARKRKKLRRLDYNSPEYWNRLLAQEGLTMRQGLHPKLSYQGSASDLEYIEGERRTDTGRITPKQQAE
jgi:hypothetical protein